jgi:hypothetical protein
MQSLDMYVYVTAAILFACFLFSRATMRPIRIVMGKNASGK